MNARMVTLAALAAICATSGDDAPDEPAPPRARVRAEPYWSDVRVYSRGGPQLSAHDAHALAAARKKRERKAAARLARGRA